MLINSDKTNLFIVLEMNNTINKYGHIITKSFRD